MHDNSALFEKIINMLTFVPSRSFLYIHCNKMIPVFILFIFFTKRCLGQEIDATINVGNATFDPSKNVTMERITQPTRSQSRHVERTLEPNKTDHKNITEFKPSPPLETYYEFNKFPVKPAFPEAKTLRDSPWTSSFDGGNRWNDKSGGHEQTKDGNWESKVKFPNENRPYQFVTNTGENRYLPPQSYLTNKEGFAFNKPVETHKYTKPVYGLEPLDKSGPWDYQRHPITQKTVAEYSYNIMEKPAVPVQKTYESGMSEYDMSPWKKILKLLVTFIPIGLLISALTPSVISVSSTNDTYMQTRFRSDDTKKELAEHLVSSLNYFDKLNENGCEFRVFCELLVTASNMQNSEEHVKNLLDNFAKQEKDLKNKADDLKKVFEAVKSQDCGPIKCRNIKKPR